MNRLLKINDKDNVAVALVDLRVGDIVDGLTVLNDINKGHKMALEDIGANQQVIKYGYPIGLAIADIKKGSLVHTANLTTNLDNGEITLLRERLNKPGKLIDDIDVYAYQRANGKFGIRNEIWVIPTVGCINGLLSNYIKDFSLSHPNLSNYDGIKLLSHPYGCSQLGDDLNNTKKILQVLALNPNAGAVIIVGLGCENNQLKEFMNFSFNDNTSFLNLQDINDEHTEFMSLLLDSYRQVVTMSRIKTKLSNITFGMKCGGSDAFSGISANPLIGLFADQIILNGGSVVLTEIPEMFGTEHIFEARSKDAVVKEEFVRMITDFKNYYRKNGQVIYANPSPGNKEGGITTLEEKSLGCIQKGGLSPLNDVLSYGEVIHNTGLQIVSAPGNDLVSVTALIAASCPIILFSTGRGTPFGGIVPTVKIATNTQLYQQKPHWIDFNAGIIVDGETMPKALFSLTDYLCSVVNGQKTKNEQNGASEIAIFKNGVTL